MQSWKLNEMDVAPQSPQVLDSESEGRAIVIALRAGESLSDHQVHERAWLVVTDGEIEIASPDGDGTSGGPGLLTTFEPNERHAVTATTDARLLLVLSPWPGEGHPSRRD